MAGQLPPSAKSSGPDSGAEAADHRRCADAGDNSYTMGNNDFGVTSVWPPLSLRYHSGAQSSQLTDEFVPDVPVSAITIVCLKRSYSGHDSAHIRHARRGCLETGDRKGRLTDRFVGEL